MKTNEKLRYLIDEIGYSVPKFANLFNVSEDTIRGWSVDKDVPKYPRQDINHIHSMVRTLIEERGVPIESHNRDYIIEQCLISWEGTFDKAIREHDQRQLLKKKMEFSSERSLKFGAYEIGTQHLKED